MPGPTPEALRLLFGEAKDLLAAQLDALAKMDSKAEAVARFNLLIVGFVVAGATIVPPRIVEPLAWPMPALTGGFALIVVSTVMAVRSYLKSEIAVGPRSRSLVHARDFDLDEREFHLQMIAIYGRGIEVNHDVTRIASVRLKWALWALTSGLLLLAATAISLIVM